MNVPSHVPTSVVVEFDIYAPPGAQDDFHRAWAALQRAAPPEADLVWTTSNGGHWIPVRGKAIHEIFADNRNFSSRYATVPRERAVMYTAKPQTLDLPMHRPFRALLSKAFSPKAIRRLEEKIRQFSVTLLEEITGYDRCDFTADYASKLPIQVFMSLVNLPFDDAPMLKNWTDQLSRPDGMTLSDIYENYRAYLRPYIAQRKSDPGDDLLSDLVLGTIDGRPVTDEEAMDLCTQVLFGGLDTVAALLGFVMHFLACSLPEQRELREHPGRIGVAIEELLRRFPIATPGRVVAKDHVYGSTFMKEGDIVMMGTMVHGLDEREFTDPFTVDFDRELGPISTFGNGIHQCPGQFLAKAELRITLEEWLSRIPEFSLEGKGKVQMRGGQVGLITSLPISWGK